MTIFKRKLNGYSIADNQKLLDYLGQYSREFIKISKKNAPTIEREIVKLLYVPVFNAQQTIGILGISRKKYNTLLKKQLLIPFNNSTDAGENIGTPPCFTLMNVLLAYEDSRANIKRNNVFD